jgi:hypothetical protein
MEPALVLTFSMGQAQGMGLRCPWYLCKSPSLASRKFTVYFTDLAIKIRISNVSWERPWYDWVLVPGRALILPHGLQLGHLAKISLPFSDILRENVLTAPQMVIR